MAAIIDNEINPDEREESRRRPLWIFLLIIAGLVVAAVISAGAYALIGQSHEAPDVAPNTSPAPAPAPVVVTQTTVVQVPAPPVQTVTNTVFSSGRIDLALSPATTVFQPQLLIPGSTVFGRVVVGNSGSVPLRYTLSETATNPDGMGLAAALSLDVVALPSTSSPCDSTTSFASPLNAPGTSLASSTVFGNPATGADAGDRLVPNGSQEALCFRVALPGSSTIGGATTTATFTFAGEQSSSKSH